MNPKNFRKLLRQKPPKADGTPGRFSIRFWFTGLPENKACRVEIGLGTNDEQEAIRTGAVVMNTIYALSQFYGGKLCRRVSVDDDKNGIPLQDAILRKGERRKERPLARQALPLFAEIAPSRKD